jgi:hypothetical protein
MSKFFEVKVKYQKVDENGKDKMISEPYILDAVSFSDAEMRINKEMEPFINGEFSVQAIKVSNISEIIMDDNCDYFYKCKITFIALDEDKGTERRHSTNVLFSADNVVDANNKADIWMKDVVSNYSIDGVDISKIVDYFRYESNEDLLEENEEE